MINLITQNGFKISQVLSKRCNAWLILKDNTSILADTGMENSFGKLKSNLDVLLPVKNQLSWLLLTHTHFDHCRSARRLQETYHCKVITSENAVSSVQSGYTRLPEGTNFATKFLSHAGHSLLRKKFGYEAFQPDRTISDDCTLLPGSEELKIITTPGHSADSISLIVDNEIAIVGDAMIGVFKNEIFPPFADDIPQMIRSWRKLLDTGCTTFLPGHGRPVSRALLEKELEKYSRAI